jgi:hypothetical protein
MALLSAPPSSLATLPLTNTDLADAIFTDRSVFNPFSNPCDLWPNLNFPFHLIKYGVIRNKHFMV